jgi:hypothetical protein
MATTTKKVEAENKPKEERVKVMVPKVDGEDPEMTVIVNYKVTRFKRGVIVDVPLSVAEVLEQSSQQMMTAQANQEKFKDQRTDL